MEPLSHMLFVLAMEVLNGRLAWLIGWISSRHWASRQFAATHHFMRMILSFLLRVATHPKDLHVLREILNIFGHASRLFTNLDKCVATSIQCIGAHLDHIQSVLQCKIVEFMYRYLGIPLHLQTEE